MQLHQVLAECEQDVILQTMANQGFNPLVAIQLTLSGQLYAEGEVVVTSRYGFDDMRTDYIRYSQG